MWEDSFHQVVKDLGIGVPVVPLDGLTRADFSAEELSLPLQLATNRPGNVFVAGDEMVISVTNKSSKDVYLELIGTSEKGEKVILAPASTIVKAGKQFRFPEAGGIKVRGGVGKEQITLFACDESFPAGEVLRGQGTTDRFVHSFYRLVVDRGQPRLEFNPTRMIKRTIEIETK
jgi:serine/threonine-protein kinase